MLAGWDTGVVHHWLHLVLAEPIGFMNQVSRIRLASSSEMEGVDIQVSVSEEMEGKGGAAWTACGVDDRQSRGKGSVWKG